MAKSPATEDSCPLPPPGGPHPAMGGSLLRFALALVAFLLVQAGLRSVVVPGGGTLIGSKMQQLQKDVRYDTIFLGSSHVYRAFIPEVFDAEMAAGGVDLASFNFGIPLPSTVELHYLLRTALAESGGELKRVFVQFYDLVPQVDPDQAFMARNVYWHDWEATALAIERSWEFDQVTPGGIHLAPDPKRRHAILAIAERLLPARFYLARQHTQHLIKRQMLVARGKEILRGVLNKPYGMAAQWRASAGYLSLEDDSAQRRSGDLEKDALGQRRSSFLENTQEYLDHIDRLRHEDLVWGDVEWVNSEVSRFNDLGVYQSMARVARAAGVELIVVVMPSNSCDRVLEVSMEQELGVPVLIYNDPRTHPQFFAPELRFDSGHLTAEGAALFSKTLAADYLALTGNE